MLPHHATIALAQVDQSTPLHLLFGGQQWSEVPDADLAEVVEYLRRSKYLRLPFYWVPYICNPR